MIPKKDFDEDKDNILSNYENTKIRIFAGSNQIFFFPPVDCKALPFFDSKFISSSSYI